MLFVGSEDLLMIFVGLELLGLSLYILAGFNKTDLGSAEAGLKYFLFGSVASAFTLFGFSLIYGMTGQQLSADRPNTNDPHWSTVARCRCRDGADWFRVQNRSRSFSSLGA